MSICWHDGPRLDCRHDDGAYIVYGRCRTGCRWFWTAEEVTGDPDAPRLHGTADNEDAAMSAAREAVGHLAAGGDALAQLRHGAASRRLQKLNAERRSHTAQSAGAEASAVEYLYGTRVAWPDDGPEIREVVQYRITRKTAKRVYYVRQESRRRRDEEIGYVDREALERDGEVIRRSGHWYEADFRLHATRDAAEAHIGIGQYAPKVPDLAQLKQEMADAHPDRGGTAEEFIAARKRYERAAQRAAAAQREAS